MSTSVNCPVCEKKVIWEPNSIYRPFCSERCKMIDLGDWASDQHAIAGEDVYLADEDQPLQH